MTKPILIVEDEPMQRQMLGTLLRRKLNLEAQEAENGREALRILQSDTTKTIKLVILDLDMPVMGGLETLQVLHAQYPGIPVIMLTGSQNIDDAITAMKYGAVDFLTKPYEGDRMAITVKNALKISTLSKEVSRLKNEQYGTSRFDSLIGHDSGLLHVVSMGRKAANADIPVLITGETGTGKEVFAKAIHGESARKGAPFIAVNCGAIPSQLVESTLFGHEKGAFTGATDKVIGKFREAEGGTIFLDEVGELPLDAQVKLLRVLQQKEVEPVGAGKPVPVNLRVISATNRDLQAGIDQARFREDLFFRLNVLQIELPPLRNRYQDIPALANHFIERFCSHEGAMPKEIAKDTLQMLMRYDWPGNVRQLENTINRAMVMSDGSLLKIDGLCQTDNSAQIYRDTTAHQSIQIIDDNGIFKTIRDLEYDAMRIALKHCDKNITQAAKALGMAKSTFYKKMASLSIEP